MEQMEIEVKFPVGDLALTRRLLVDNGARPLGRCFESNALWDTPGRDLSRSGAVLRLRRDAQCRLTLKSRAPGADPRFKIHREIETVVSDAKAMEGILAGLGFCVAHRYEKYRETFAFEGVQAVLDELPYGDFLELEGSKEGIQGLAGRLGLEWGGRIVLSYLEIFAIIRKEEPLGFSDATFDLFSGTRISLDKYLPRFTAKQGK